MKLFVVLTLFLFSVTAFGEIPRCSNGYSNLELAKDSVLEFFEFENFNDCVDLEIRSHNLATDHFRKECVI